MFASGAQRLSPSRRSPNLPTMSAMRIVGRRMGGKAMRSPWALMLVLLSLFGMLFLSASHERHPDMPAAAHAHAGHDGADGGDPGTGHDEDAGDQLASHWALHGETLPVATDLTFGTVATRVAWHTAVVDPHPSGEPSETLRPPQG